MSDGYFFIDSVVPNNEGGFYVKVFIKWHRNKGKAHRWGYSTSEGDELQAYKEAVEWCLGKRKRGNFCFKDYKLEQHNWRKPNKVRKEQ